MTQCEKLKLWLEEKGEIDPMTALTKLDIYRLAARINELRRRGMDIVTIPKEYVNARGQKKRYALYRLARTVDQTA